MKKEYCVYMHTAPNGKKYIGITCCQPRNRRWQNGYGYVSQTRFYNAIKKYGWENFEHIILKDGLTAEEAGELEQKYISQYNSTNRKHGYNTMVGGEVGYHLTEEHKLKIGKANSGCGNGMYGHHYTDEERKRMSETSVWKGRKHTKESLEKMREYRKMHPIIREGTDHPMYGKHHSEEARKKMSESARKKYEGGYISPRSRRVFQITVGGEIVREFDSCAEAGRKVSKSSNGGNNIQAVCKGRKKTAYGYLWKYAE